MYLHLRPAISLSLARAQLSVRRRFHSENNLLPSSPAAAAGDVRPCIASCGGGGGGQIDVCKHNAVGASHQILRAAPFNKRHSFSYSYTTHDNIIYYALAHADTRVL